MKAVLLTEIQNATKTQRIEITGDSAYHLIRVFRIKEDEELLVFNGNGLELKGKAESVKKLSLVFSVDQVVEHSDKRFLNLVIGTTKKDALEEIIRKSTELGFKNIYLAKTQYSQPHYLKDERVEKLIESALIQSNNPFSPKIHPSQELDQLYALLKKESSFLLTVSGKSTKLPEVTPGKEITLVVGPEGGFSTSEEEVLLDHCQSLHLNCPILRAPTAVCAAAGKFL